MTSQQQNLLCRLMALLAFVNSNQEGERPHAVIRPKLPKELRITQAELVQALGARRKTELDQKLRYAVVVTSRIHTGKDCFRTIGGAVTRLHANLEDRFERSSLEARLRCLSDDPVPSASIAELRQLVETLRESRIEEALQLKQAFDIFSEELGRNTLVLRFREMQDERLMESLTRLRYSLSETATEILQTEKLRAHERQGERLRRFNRDRNRYSRETFTAWCKKHYGRGDARRARRLRNALAFAEAFTENQAA